MSDASSRPAGGSGEGARPDPEALVVGHVTRAHGTKGEVFVWPLTDSPDRVFAAGADVLLGDEEANSPEPAQWLRVEGSRPFKRGTLVKFEGCGDRSDAEPLAGRYLLVPTERLEPLSQDEVFYHQLLGLRVVTKAGEDVGTVREVYDTDPAPLLEVKGDGKDEGKVRLIPYTERIVRRVDVTGGRIVIAPPDGLLEL